VKNQIEHGVRVVAVLFLVAAFAQPGSAQTHTQHTAQQATRAKIVLPDPVQQAAADTTITIRSYGSELQFLPSSIAVRAGTRLRIRYINEGTFPHNIVVVKTDNDIDPLGTAAFNAGSTGYVPLDMTDRMIAHSPLAPPGETIEFTFTVPDPGEYPFVCLYPGHYNMMVGELKSLR
jgi:uncharacterized cupredoxin-like copper-binding protein